ncbi:PH domain-containing protein [Streptomyces sp. NPDC060031]|uniref:PH domain-containing protein n=1 Tax=Streptomyces sp. NPDC060031 TaxID=3347043 RepID=UPI00369FD4FB
MKLRGRDRMATAERLPVWFRVTAFVLPTAFVAFAAYARPRRFTALDREGISVRGPLRVRRLPWAELRDVRAESVRERLQTAGAPRVQAYVYLADGKRVLLPCVDDVELVAARTEVAFIRSVWAELRGPGWQPDPDAQVRIARAVARRERRLRALSGWPGRLAAAAVVGASIVLSLIAFG